MCLINYPKLPLLSNHNNNKNTSDIRPHLAWIEMNLIYHDVLKLNYKPVKAKRILMACFEALNLFRFLADRVYVLLKPLTMMYKPRACTQQLTVYLKNGF